MPDRTCSWCGGDISHKKSNAVFCSRTCKGNSSSKRRREKNPEKMRAYHTEYSRKWARRLRERQGKTAWRKEKRNCKNCGSSFSPTNHNQLHCTYKCKQEYAASRYEPTRLEPKRRKMREKYQLETYGQLLEPMHMHKDRYRKARQLGYRSGLEVAVARQLEEEGIPFEYEAYKIYFTHPARRTYYSPDFILPNGIVIETKGQFQVKDRKKHLIIKEAYPDLDLRLVFSNSNTKISKGSKTSYAMWCERHGFLYHDRVIPQKWKDEPIEEKRLQALKEAGIK